MIFKNIFNYSKFFNRLVAEIQGGNFLNIVCPLFYKWNYIPYFRIRRKRTTFHRLFENELQWLIDCITT